MPAVLSVSKGAERARPAESAYSWEKYREQKDTEKWADLSDSDDSPRRSGSREVQLLPETEFSTSMKGPGALQSEPAAVDESLQVGTVLEDSAALRNNQLAKTGIAQDQLQPLGKGKGKGKQQTPKGTGKGKSAQQFQQGADGTVRPARNKQCGKRFNPRDGKAYNFEDFKKKYRQYSEEENRNYFNKCDEAMFHIRIGAKEFKWGNDPHWFGTHIIHGPTGRGGENMKNICEACNYECRLRLCGEGSPTKEPDGTKSTGPLTLCVPCDTIAAYEKASELAAELIGRVHAEYRKHCIANNKPCEELEVTVKRGCR